MLHRGNDEVGVEAANSKSRGIPQQCCARGVAKDRAFHSAVDSSREFDHRFGREVRPNGTVLRWNGVGIGAEPGTPVRAVRGGTVVLAGPFEGYGPTVVLSHGDGFYTLYLYLREVGVLEGRRVDAGEVVGTVGGADTPEGPHVEFQVRAPQGGGSPQAQDPLLWLRAPTAP